MKPVQFDQLPYLCLRKIFSFLKLRDLANCRAVNRLFMSYADQVRVDELDVKLDEEVVRPYKRFRFCERWYQNNSEVVRNKSTITWKQFQSARSSSSFDLDQLKFLYIYGQFDCDSYSGLLSGFKQLVRLELESYSSSRRDPKPLALPNLKVLVVHLGVLESLVLKTPKLEVLACPNISAIRVEHPETIKRIECILQLGGDLATFKNLQVFVCHCPSEYYYAEFDRVHLSKLKSLRELQIHTDICTDDLDFEVIELFMSWLVDLMHQTKSKREELKLYLDEVPLINAERLENYRAILEIPDPFTPFDHLFMFKHYRQLPRDTYPDVIEVELNELMELDVQLSSDFFDRFPEIQKLMAYGRVDRDRFEWFLQNASAVRELTLCFTLLDQTALDRLPEINNRLTYLEVNDSETSPITNFVHFVNFILRFPKLQTFKTNLKLGSLDLAAKAFRQLNDLENFDFKSGDEYVRIARCSSIKNDYSLNYCRFGIFDEHTGPPIFEGLPWYELAALYDLMRGVTAAGSKKRRTADEKSAKVKRARLQ